MDFQMPKHCRILLLLEVIEGTNFEYDNCHVQYEMKFPSFMKLIDGKNCGATHSSLRRNNAWHFGHCHSFLLDIDDEFAVVQCHNKVVFNFEVISIDKVWERERREGLTYFAAPVDSGNTFHQELVCYRERQGANFFVDWMERFFLGGLHKTTFFDKNTVNNEVMT